jgi:hypothetical protein
VVAKRKAVKVLKSLTVKNLNLEALFKVQSLDEIAEIE